MYTAMSGSLCGFQELNLGHWAYVAPLPAEHLSSPRFSFDYSLPIVWVYLNITIIQGAC